jgi:predicted site-specific integrase-resolvase
MQLIPESVEVAHGPALLTIREVSQLTGVSIDTLKFLQLSGDGPAYVEEHGRVRYTVESVADWQAQRSVAHQRMMAYEESV